MSIDHYTGLLLAHVHGLNKRLHWYTTSTCCATCRNHVWACLLPLNSLLLASAVSRTARNTHRKETKPNHLLMLDVGDEGREAEWRTRTNFFSYEFSPFPCPLASESAVGALRKGELSLFVLGRDVGGGGGGWSGLASRALLPSLQHSLSLFS